MIRFLTPNRQITPREQIIVSLGWLGVVAVGWEAFRSPIFPSIQDIVGAYPALWTRNGLGAALLSSLTTSLEALLLSTIVSLPLAYLSKTPFFRPLGITLSKLRFLSPSVFFLILLFLSPSAHMVKVLMLAGAETFFLVTAMMTIVGNVPQFRYDDAYTLKMGEWQTTFYVIVRSTLADALDAVRDNAAMGWAMLMMVEGFVRSEGGVGVLLLTQEKYMNFAQVYAIAATIVLVGLFQDFMIGKLKETLCPYTVKK
jgi:NitT/TauT family transport system permease protein